MFGDEHRRTFRTAGGSVVRVERYEGLIFDRVFATIDGWWWPWPRTVSHRVHFKWNAAAAFEALDRELRENLI